MNICSSALQDGNTFLLGKSSCIDGSSVMEVCQSTEVLPLAFNVLKGGAETATKVAYFHDLLTSEKVRLAELCTMWNDVLTSDGLENISDEGRHFCSGEGISFSWKFIVNNSWCQIHYNCWLDSFVSNSYWCQIDYNCRLDRFVRNSYSCQIDYNCWLDRFVKNSHSC